MMSMISLRPTADQIERARAREADMRAKIIARHGREHLNNSIREGEGVLVGLVGEELVHDRYLFARSAGEDIYHFDLLDSVFLGRIDVKTKSCTGQPQPGYWCTVCAANTEQICDYYCFVRVLEDLSRAWIMGFLPKPNFFNKAVFFNKGDLDPTSHCGWTFRWDCYNVPVSQLWAPPWDRETLKLQGLQWKPKRCALST
jgi:hypothetical protein